NNKTTHVKKVINKEICTCINKLQLAHITEKQAIYIINSVIIPRLSYQLYSTYLSQNQLYSLNKLYTNIVRHKAKLAHSIPISFLHHPEIYSLLSLPLIQTSHLVSSLSRNLNHIGFNFSFLKFLL